MYNPDRPDKIANLVERYRSGAFSEVVFTASLIAVGERKNRVDELDSQNQSAFRQSLPYLRGEVQ